MYPSRATTLISAHIVRLTPIVAIGFRFNSSFRCSSLLPRSFHQIANICTLCAHTFASCRPIQLSATVRIRSRTLRPLRPRLLPTTLYKNDCFAAPLPPSPVQSNTLIMPAFLPTPPALREISARKSSSETPRRPRHPKMSVKRINNPTDFAAALPLPQSNPLSPLVVFSFVTPGCRACNYASNAYRRLANDFALQSPHRQVRFCEMDVSERQNHSLGQRLGVNAVPALQVYAFKGDQARGGVGVLDEAVGPRMVDKVRKKLDVYLSDSFNLDEYVFEDA